MNPYLIVSLLKQITTWLLVHLSDVNGKIKYYILLKYCIDKYLSPFVITYNYESFTIRPEMCDKKVHIFYFDCI